MSPLPLARRAEPAERYLPCVSPPMQALAASIARVAATDAPVMICGETGSGKSTLARQVYEDSPRHAAPLIVLHSATATVEVIEALARHAERMVLFEEVSELAPVVQDRLVRLLAGQPPRAGLRLVATSSRDLTAVAKRGSLRADLLYRLDVVRLDIPPLRQRPDDIIFLAEHFLAVAARHFRRDVRALSPDACARLLKHRWCGNVRELSNCITESVLYCAHMRLRAGDVRLREAPAGGDPDAELTNVLARLCAVHPGDFNARVQRLLLQWALQACGGNRVRTAALLGIGRGALRAQLRRYGLDGTRAPSREPIGAEARLPAR